MAHVLEISEASDRPTVNIFGNEYPLAFPGDLSLSDELRVSRTAKRSGEVSEMSLEEAKAFEDELRGSVKPLVPDCPDDVLAKLKDSQRLSLITAFYGEAAKAAKTTTTPKKSKPRSSKSSRASKPSTAAAQASGDR